MLAANARDLSFQIAHTGLPCVMPDDEVDRFILKFDLIRLKTAVFAAARHKILLCDLHLFFFRVSRQLDDFHAIA